MMLIFWTFLRNPDTIALIRKSSCFNAYMSIKTSYTILNLAGSEIKKNIRIWDAA